MWNHPGETKMRVRHCTDLLESKISPADDGFHLSTPEIGDFEWWYFDVHDPDNHCTLKVVAHLGTDPLRKKLYPQLVVSINSPTEKQTFTKVYALDDFTACTEYCDVRLGNEFRVYVDASNETNLYHIVVNVDGISAKLDFDGCLEGCKPIGDEVEAERGKKQGAFFWAIPLPKAKVRGEFSVGARKYAIREGLGYHDHNYWKVGGKPKLFMDDIISKWYWGRCFIEDYTIIFMDIYFRGGQIKSLLVGRGNSLIHCSNKAIEVSVSDFKKDGQLYTSYPTRITVKSIVAGEPFQMILRSKELAHKRDLLEDVDPIVRWFIRFLVSKPAYFVVLADGTMKLADKEVKGTALYEMMYFRDATHLPPRMQGA